MNAVSRNPVSNTSFWNKTYRVNKEHKQSLYHIFWNLTPFDFSTLFFFLFHNQRVAASWTTPYIRKCCRVFVFSMRKLHLKNWPNMCVCQFGEVSQILGSWSEFVNTNLNVKILCRPIFFRGRIPLQHYKVLFCVSRSF